MWWMRRGSSNINLVSFSSPTLESGTFAETVRQWNGNIFWEPASKSDDIITKFGDEARAVFGPIPDGDCAADSGKTIPLEVDGNIVDLKTNLAKPDHPLEFEHKDVTGNVVKWTDGIPKCDKPSLAGNVSYCGLNSRLNRVDTGSVQWLFFCRKSSESLEVTNDPYWQRSDPRYAVFGTIGYNSRSGEIVFFDGNKGTKVFDWSKPFVPPGGRSYSDASGRRAAAALYDPTFQIPCFACHDNKNANVIDPHAEQARVGYFFGRADPRAAAFSLGDYLPETPRLQTSPFRVIGSGYTATYGFELSRARIVRDPTGNCTTCHTLTSLGTGRRLAPDAVARDPWTSSPTFAQTFALGEELKRVAAVTAHRTDWALRSGLGKIHPWMSPVLGNDLAAQPPGIGRSDWFKLSDCLWRPLKTGCDSSPLYTLCPAPESGQAGDPAGPTHLAADIRPAPEKQFRRDKVVQITWKYLDDYGGVPERDDVRFNVAVKETDIPPGGKPPAVNDYPAIEDAAGKNVQPIDREIGVSGSATLIQNASYAGHLRWTDPEPATTPREYRINLPGTCNRRYLIRILPKRFCFDQSGIAYSSVDHLVYADVGCN
jgi:hypothetical protein